MRACLSVFKHAYHEIRIILNLRCSIFTEITKEICIAYNAFQSVDFHRSNCIFQAFHISSS